MPEIIDLREFIGVVEVEGATNLRDCSRQDGDGSALVAGELDTRRIKRFLISDTPFIVRGRHTEYCSANSLPLHV